MNRISMQVYRGYSQQLSNFSRRRPMNTILNIVPQKTAFVIERLGKFHRVLEPGVSLLIPFVDKIAYTQNLKEFTIEIKPQSAITKDNVTMHIDGVLYLRVVDAYKASYGIEDLEFSISQIAQTTMRNEIGKMALDSVFKERANLNEAIVSVINEAAFDWGSVCLRYEIRDIILLPNVIESMQLQAAAERKKRAIILESEAEKQETINKAAGEAEAITIKLQAIAKGIENVSHALNSQQGKDAAALMVADKYLESYNHLARESTTMLLPAAMNDPASLITQAMSIFTKINTSNQNQQNK